MSSMPMLRTYAETASTALHAAEPVSGDPLVEVTGREVPKTLADWRRLAELSKGVDVPWASMWLIVGRDSVLTARADASEQAEQLFCNLNIMKGCVVVGLSGRRQCSRPDHRRERHRKRHHCPAHPWTVSVEGGTVCESELSGDSWNLAGKRTVRLRKGRVYRRGSKRGRSNRLMAERCFSTKFQSSTCRCNPSSCSYCKMASSAGSAPRKTKRSRCGWCARPTGTWKRRLKPGRSARIFTIASTS